MKRLLIILTVLISLLLLAGCAGQNVPTNYRWANVDGGQINQTQPGEEFYFTVPVDKTMFEPVTIPIRIRVAGTVNTGSLHFELRQPGGQAVWKSETYGQGAYSVDTNYMPGQDQLGDYTLGIVYEANTSASYNLSWHALKVGPSVLLPGIGMLLVSLVFIGYSLRNRLGWRYLLLGSLFWIITVVAKFAFAIPVNPLVYKALGVTYEGVFSPGNLVTYVYIGALTGIFEAGLAWLILRKVRWGHATWKQALAFGIGFGVIEALLLSISSMGSAAAGILSPDALPVPALGSLAQAGSLPAGLAPISERLMVIFAHIFSCVLLFFSIARRESKWAWIAILYKTLLDTPAGFAAFWGVGTPAKLWTIEATIALFGLLGLWGTFTIARRYPREEAAETPAAPQAEAI